MTATLRMTGRILQTSTHHYRHPDTGRWVWLVGVGHVGTPEYFDHVKEFLVTVVREHDAVVHLEDTSVPDDQLAAAGPQERAVVLAMVEAAGNRVRTYQPWGWTSLLTSLADGDNTWPQGWQRCDLTTLEMIRNGGEPIAALVRQQHEMYAQAMTSPRRARQLRAGEALQWRRLAYGAQQPPAPSDAVVFRRRDEVALAGIRDTTRNLARVLGANHLPAIGAGLVADGFMLEHQTWHSMGRLPSLPAMIATLLGATLLPGRAAGGATTASTTPATNRPASSPAQTPDPHHAPAADRGVRRGSETTTRAAGSTGRLATPEETP